MTYASVNGLELYYEIHGTGEPLVLLHGGLHTFDLSFGAMLPELAASHQVIGVELQGHGRTADIDRELSIGQFADDVAALLKHLGVARADVMGFSLGALVALELGVRHQDVVGRLVLAAAHARPDGYHTDITDPSAWATSTRMPTADDFAEMAAEYARVAPRPKDFQPFQQKLSAMVASSKGWTDDELRSVAAPTLLVIGDHDFVRIEHAAQMLELIPTAQLGVVPGTTHAGLLRRADVLLPMVAAFLSRS
ncbi:alpha/beta fold hydrolase [Fodinicola acaciae]|uniref:alpha/beta fold hydrolase n=1 Tax=Fodinicola acaciae TaxID=2681555 RepID=UPI001C9E325C|nr:alpha/beta hydrolase [Fodinicola acaciae]